MLDPTYDALYRMEDNRKYRWIPIQIYGIDSILLLMRSLFYKETFKESWSTGVKRLVQYSASAGRDVDLLDQYARLNCRGYTYHPLIQLFFDHYDSLRARELWEQCAAKGLSREQILRLVLSGCKEAAKKNGLMKRVSDWEVRYKNIRRKSLSLESNFFNLNKRGVVVFLNLSYSSADISDAEYNSAFAQCENGIDGSKLKVSFRRVQEDRARFFERAKKAGDLFENFAAYIWHVECVPVAGYSLNVALLFGEAECRSHHQLALEIGGWWVKNITQGSGRFLSFNSKLKEDMPGYCLGVIDRSDRRKRMNLLSNVFRIIGRNTELVQLIPHAGAQLFRCQLVVLKKEQHK